MKPKINQATKNRGRAFLSNEKGMRSPRMVLISFVLLALSLTILIDVAWVPADSMSYIQSRSEIQTIHGDALKVFASEPVPAIHQDTKPTITLAPTSFEVLDQYSNDTNAEKSMVIRFELEAPPLRSLATAGTFVFVAPALSYERAEAWIEDKHVRSFRKGETVNLTLDSSILFDTTLAIDIVYSFMPSLRPIIAHRDFAGALVASQNEYHQYVSFRSARGQGGAGKIGHLTKVVIALFCILLFLIIDSSPESLGLALFMGFEAVAMGASEGWLPLGWLGIEKKHVVTNFCFQMGDIMKLYFLLQIARVGSTNPKWWLIIGSAASLPYAFFMQYAAEHSINWTYLIPRTRDTLTGGIGAAFCVYTLWQLRDKKLPWRHAALIVAGIAGFSEVLNSWVAHADMTRTTPWLKTFFTVYQANIGYLFALSTFLNISTLENRVRTLTAEKEVAEEMRRQLELSQSVQKSFLALPTLPPEINIAWSYEAAAFVSGDTYFVFWDEERATLTILVNDVTGHGMQAGLKAFACNVIAKTLWCEPNVIDFRRRGERRQLPSRLEKYDDLVDRLLCRADSPPDFNAMVGIEFRLDEAKAMVYRVNYNFPILIEPNFAWSNLDEKLEGSPWKVKTLGLVNQVVTTLDMKPGSIIILVSDGLVDSARKVAGLVGALKEYLATRHERLNSTDIKQVAYDWMIQNSANEVDDKTIVVFQWAPQQAVNIEPGPTALRA